MNATTSPVRRCRLQERLRRVALANQVLLEISRVGRRFFYNKTDESVAYFVVVSDHVYFVDDWTGEMVYVHYNGKWKKFSHGGTLRSLVEALRDYITKGVLVPSGHFGPWPDYYCEGDLWGYGKDTMDELRETINTLGVLQ